MMLPSMISVMPQICAQQKECSSIQDERRLLLARHASCDATATAADATAAAADAAAAAQRSAREGAPTCPKLAPLDQA